MDCLLLGQPKQSKLPPADAGNVPGKVVALQIGSSRFEFFLCAHVRDDVYWCHRGSFLDDTFDAENPFDEKDLLLKDIFKASQELSQSKKRIRVHHHPGELRETALNSPDAWNRLVATSKWKAEELRAADQHRPIDKEDAFSNYEKNCWVWSTSDRVQIGVMWSWRVGNLQKRAVVHSRLDNLLARRIMNPPCDLGVADADLLERLESIATSEMVRHRAPCQYLGLHVGAQRFEPDPSKWPSRLDPMRSSKTHAVVWFEWLHVTRDGQPHRVDAKVDHLLFHQRPVPAHPLKNSTPSQLTFSIEFMVALGRNIHNKIEFKGVVFDGEHPQLVLELPGDGLDIQDENCHWVLLDGRCVVMSARQMANIRDDQLEEDDCHEAYRAVGREFGYDSLGQTGDAMISTLKENPGTLQERIWERCPWTGPANETESCWWIANASEIDKSQELKLVCKSLAILRLELQAKRCATSAKLRQEYERRVEDNARAVDVLDNNQHLWRHVGGSDPQMFLRPSENSLGRRGVSKTSGSRHGRRGVETNGGLLRAHPRRS